MRSSYLGYPLGARHLDDQRKGNRVCVGGLSLGVRDALYLAPDITPVTRKEEQDCSAKPGFVRGRAEDVRH